jgi:hypothetical protein
MAEATRGVTTRNAWDARLVGVSPRATVAKMCYGHQSLFFLSLSKFTWRRGAAESEEEEEEEEEAGVARVLVTTRTHWSPRHVPRGAWAQN